MDNAILKKYENGNFTSIYIGAKPTIKLAMLRLENFISYYFRGPGGLDYSSDILNIKSYAREIFYIEQSDIEKFESWIVYYDDENDCLAIRHCIWNKGVDRKLIMADEKLRTAVRDKGIVGIVPHISNQTIIGVNKTSKDKILSAIKEFDNLIFRMDIMNLINNLDYYKGDYRISRSYDLDVRIEAIINKEQNEIYLKLEDIIKLIFDGLTQPLDKSLEYKIALDYQLSPIGMLQNTYGISDKDIC